MFFLNGVESRNAFDKHIACLWGQHSDSVVRVIVSPENPPLGLAIREMVDLAKNEFVLLLKKGWALLEPITEPRAQLSVSVSLIEEEIVKLYAFDIGTTQVHHYMRISCTKDEKSIFCNSSTIFIATCIIGLTD